MVLSVQIHQSYVPISQVVVAHKHRGKNGVYIHIYIYCYYYCYYCYILHNNIYLYTPVIDYLNSNHAIQG